MFDQAFISEIEQLALQIAKLQRNEDHLQSEQVLLFKLNRELAELEDADEVWDEIPDVVYYAFCLIVQIKASHVAAWVVTGVLAQHQVTIEQAKAACLAKYRLRAAGHPKDIEVERAAILAAIEGI